jgi:hypothetical protein
MANLFCQFGLQDLRLGHQREYSRVAHIGVINSGRHDSPHTRKSSLYYDSGEKNGCFLNAPRLPIQTNNHTTSELHTHVMSNENKFPMIEKILNVSPRIFVITYETYLDRRKYGYGGGGTETVGTLPPPSGALPIDRRYNESFFESGLFIRQPARRPRRADAPEPNHLPRLQTH